MAGSFPEIGQSLDRPTCQRKTFGGLVTTGVLVSASEDFQRM
jgi:hypothetical protein